MKKTAVFCTDEERQQLSELAQQARTTPVILIGGVDVAGNAWRRAAQECHRLALAHGLPEIQGFYGVTESGEFVET